jgi:L-amino acid N-acyltransferase YncA
VAAEDPDRTLVGFGFLRPYSPHSTFAQTGMITYFVESSRTRRGIGTAILRHLTEGARSQGIVRILAHVSSKNPQSLAFHRKHGFIECGRFPEIGRKFGEPFDVVWMIKTL